MKGFRWAPRDSQHRWPDPPLGGDLWCVRDAFCSLFGWQIGGAEWASFVEAPEPQDMPRLEQHLGLVGFDPDHEPEKWRLIGASGHPGISCWNLRAERMAHVLYEPDLRQPRTIPPQYWPLGPERFRILVDIQQSPSQSS
jgi:hypothetical protein